MSTRRAREKLRRSQKRKPLPSVHDEVEAMFAELQGPRRNYKTPVRDGQYFVRKEDAPDDLWRPDWAKRVEKLRANKKK